MRVAVLGGTRFIGPAIVRDLLGQGHEVAVYHRGRTMHAFEGDVRDVTADRQEQGQTAAALKENRPEAIIDMCGYWSGQVEEAALAVPDLRQYVFCGSTAVYGRIGKTTPAESTPTDAGSEYERGKVACEDALLALSQERELGVTILRLAHPYGPLDQLLYGTGRESLFLDRMRHGRPIVIPGQGDTRIHPIYVDDAAHAFVHLLDHPDCLGRIFNLSGDEVLSLDDYFASIARALGKPLVASHVPVAWLDANGSLWAESKRNFKFAPTWCRYESAFDVTALRATGFRCQTDHDRGVEATIAWLDEQQLIPASSDDDLEDIVARHVG